jgi:hypothetical protein
MSETGLNVALDPTLEQIEDLVLKVPILRASSRLVVWELTNH